MLLWYRAVSRGRCLEINASALLARPGDLNRLRGHPKTSMVLPEFDAAPAVDGELSAPLTADAASAVAVALVADAVFEAELADALCPLPACWVLGR